MECLNNLIGVSPLLGDNPDSGLFLSDLDITLYQANNLQTANNTSGVDYLRSKIDFAQKSVVNDFINRLRESQPNLKAFGVNTILESNTVGRYRENKPLLAANADLLRGLFLNINNANYLALKVTSVSLMAQTTGNIDIQVWDLIQGLQIDTITVASVAGEISTADLNKIYKNNGQRYQLAFLYDAANGAYINDYNKYVGCLSCHPRWSTSNCNWTGINIEKTKTKTRSNIRTGGSSGANGLSITYTLDCDTDSLVCQLKSRLSFPLLYKTAILIADSYKLSPRINSTVKIPNAPIEDWRAWAVGEYEKVMDNLIQGIQLPNNACFKCLPRISQNAVLP
jgi:hypothetical protein